MRIRILDPHWKKMDPDQNPDPDPDPGYFYKIYWIFYQSDIFKFFVLFFSLIFILILGEPFRNQEIFIISLFSIVQIWVVRVNFFLQFLVDILPLGSGSVDPHIFADPDPGSQNRADPNPDPKHWRDETSTEHRNVNYQTRI